MSYDWIKDVLSDLRDFARANDMPDLAQHLDGALALAEPEIARARAARASCTTAAPTGLEEA